MMYELYTLIQGSPLAFADSRHTTFDGEMRFSFGEFFDGLATDGTVEMSMKLLVSENAAVITSLPQNCLLH